MKRQPKVAVEVRKPYREFFNNDKTWRFIKANYLNLEESEDYNTFQILQEIIDKNDLENTFKDGQPIPIREAKRDLKKLGQKIMKFAIEESINKTRKATTIPTKKDNIRVNVNVKYHT